MNSIPICTFPDNPVTAETRQDKKSIQLLNTFLLGPSSKNCKIEFVDTSSENDNSQEEDNKETQPTQQTQQEQPVSNAEQSSGSEQQSESGSENQDNNSLIRRHYSILEAYSSLHKVFEDETTNNGYSNQSQQQAQPQEAPANNSDQKQNKPADNKSDSNKVDDEEPKLTNDAKTTLHVRVSLLNEGYSIWTILLDSKVTNVDAVKAAIKSGNFKSARTLAIKNTNPACFIVSQVKTSVSANSNFTMNAPFIGRCRYAMDSGSDRDSSEDNTICIAIAPIDGCTRKPSEKTVFKVLYNVLDLAKVTGGSVKSIDDTKKDKPDEDDRYSGRSEKNQNALSVWINKKFTNDGDSETYDNFLKLRKFIADNLKAKNLEYDATNSENIKTYGKLPAVKAAIIAY